MLWCGGARPPNTRDCQGRCGGDRQGGGVTAGWRRVGEGEGGEEAKEDALKDALDQVPEEEGVDDALDHTVKQAPEEELYRVPQPNPK